MYKLTTIAGLLKRVRRKPELAACAIAALLFLAALAPPARAQNTYGGATVVHAGFIGLVPGQSVSQCCGAGESIQRLDWCPPPK